MNDALSIDTQIEQVVSPLLARHGYEVVLVELVSGQHILRIYIDRLDNADGAGVGVEDCAKVSHLVGDVLDAEGISERIPGRYHLEVSSPGLDRPLCKPGDFKRFVGRQVKIATRAPLNGRKRFVGELNESDERGVRVMVDGTPCAIAYELILRANLVPEL